MSSKVYLLCGVSGSGKTWVAKQVAHRFAYVPHDEHFKDHVEVISTVAKNSDKPVLTECPFGERLTKQQLEENGLEVIPVFVVEDPDLVKLRFESRENRPLPKNVYTRAASIRLRAQEWQALHGKSSEILQILLEMPL